MDPDGRLGVVQTGARYAFGFGPNFYGIWDEHASGPPMERFPATVEGKQVAWRRFVELEPGTSPHVPGTAAADAAPERHSNARRWIIVGVVLVVAIVAIVVARSGKGNKAGSGGGGGGGANTAHVVTTGDVALTIDLPKKSVSIVGLDTLIPVAEATWEDTTGQQLTFHMDGVKEGVSPAIVTAGDSLTLQVVEGTTTYLFHGQHGECTINVTSLGDTGFSGTFTCADLKTDALDKTISVTGTFAAAT